jgi:hypothetical protein
MEAEKILQQLPHASAGHICLAAAWLAKLEN